MNWRTIVLLGVGIVLMLAGGQLGAEEKAKDKVDIRGELSRISPAPDDTVKQGTLGRVLIEGVKDATTNYDKAVVRITRETKLEKRVGKERKAATFKDLKPGLRVEAVFTGPVAESYPVQATAKSLLILEDKE